MKILSSVTSRPLCAIPVSSRQGVCISGEKKKKKDKQLWNKDAGMASVQEEITVTSIFLYFCLQNRCEEKGRLGACLIINSMGLVNKEQLVVAQN